MLGLGVFAEDEETAKPPEKKEPLPITYTQFEEYWAKYYVGMTYGQALEENRPFILIFAAPEDIFAIFKQLPLGDMIFKEFDGKYNCVVINLEYGVKGRMDKYLHKKDNEEYLFNTKIAESFHVDKTPAMFLIDPKERTQQPVELNDLSEEKLREILNEYLERCIAPSDAKEPSL